MTATHNDAEARTTRLELISIGVTVALIVAAIAVAVWTNGYDGPSVQMIVFAFAVGGLGGLVHEIAQSGGKILFFERKIDGMYLGTLSGMVLGGVAGILAARGLESGAHINVFYECFLAGMALKGVIEASTGAPLPPGQQDVTAPQAALAETIARNPEQLEDLLQGAQGGTPATQATGAGTTTPATAPPPLTGPPATLR